MAGTAHRPAFVLARLCRTNPCTYDSLYLAQEKRPWQLGDLGELNYTQARQNLKLLMDTAIEDRVAITITRTASEPVIMMAKSEYDALMETFHLLRSPRNAERLREAIAGIEGGEVVRVDLVDGEIEERP